MLTTSEIKRITKEGFWVATGQIVSALGLLVGIRLLTHYVPPDVFGSINLLLGLTTLGYSLLCLPVLQAAFRFYPEETQQERSVLLRNTIIKILRQRTYVLIGIILVAGAFYSVNSTTSYWVFVPLAGILVVDIVRNIKTAFLAAARRHKIYSLWNIADSWLKPLSIIGMSIVAGISLESVLFGYFLVSVMVLVIIFKTPEYDKIINNEGTGEQNGLLGQKIRKYALPLVPLAVVGWLSGLSDRYIIGGILGLEKVGVYSAVYGLISRPFLMSGAIIEQTLRPVYFEAITAENHAVAKKTFSYWVISTVLVSVIGIIMITLMQEQIGNLLLAEKYRSGVVLMPWIALGYGFLTVSYVFEKPSYAVKKTHSVLIIQLCGSVASIGIGLPMVYYYGIVGAAMSVPLYFGVQLIIAVLYARKVMKGN